MSRRGGTLCVLTVVAGLLVVSVGGFLSPDTLTIKKEPGICRSRDIRNSVDMFSQLKGCRVVEGFIQIVLIDKANYSDYDNVTFPELREITDYLLLYRVNGLRSLGQMFPNLSVIRGNNLFLNYALVVFEVLHLQDLGLTSLTNIIRGSVYFAKNPMLCFVDTIEWDLIAPAGKGEHYITGNKLQNECPLCPTHNHSCPNSTVTGMPLCWNSLECQRVCPAKCRGSCNDDGKCCHQSCLGGCSGPSNEHCLLCKNVLFQNKCIKTCPNGTYEYLKRRCVMESDCYDMPKPKEMSDYSMRHNPWKPFEGECLIECPSGFVEVETYLHGKKRYTCKRCKGVCKKECPGASVDSIASAQRLRGCTSIKGALEIQIRGGKNVVRELEENLNLIEEIDDYLKVVRSFPIVSLNFLSKLKVIHGRHLENLKYALVVLDNQNLVELWDWNNRENKVIQIKNGTLFFHFNPKLCKDKIETLREIANLPSFTEADVASNSNGDKIACNMTELEVEVRNKTKTAVIIGWKPFNHYDPRSLLGYIVYSIEAPYQNVTMYDGRDACGGDGWRVDDVSKDLGSKYVSYILPHLKPYTQYAFYVKTYTIATERNGAQSAIKYFRTCPDIPSQPRSVIATSNSSHEISISWQPPSHPNGNLTHYKVVGHWVRDSEDYLDKRNYCLEPVTISSLLDTKHLTTKPTVETKYVQSTDESDDEVDSSCTCRKKFIETRLREKEIHVEDNLHNLIYVKNTDYRREKRDVSHDLIQNRLYSKRDKTAEDNYDEMTNGVVERFSQMVKETSVVIKNLRHFALYNVAIQACRQWEKNENINTTENCGKEAIVSVRTRRLESADNIDPQLLVWEVSNKSTGEVHLRWKDPESPNSLILLYQIIYKRTDGDNFQATQECITKKAFHMQGNNYVLKNLPPGNYSLQIRAQSLAGNGDYTPVTYFFIKEDSQVSILNVSIFIFFGVILAAVLSFFMYLHFRRQYTQVPNTKLIASVNPEYVPTVYVPDDWEVARSRVDMLQDIGQGSFGMVYEGRLKSLDGSPAQSCAVKTVNCQAADRDRIEFLNEASVMKAFNTHHVVKLLGVVSVGEPALVIMELMRLGDLKSYLRSQRPDAEAQEPVTPPSLKRILQMAAEIADGMAYLSAKKFVHRDLAARNCMVAQDLTVKIGDFGMTRDIYETDYYRKGSKGLLPVRWMAPESLKDGVFTSHSDAWSYGVVVYEMATLASQPYQGLSNDQVLRYVKEGGIMERPENCPDKLYNLMRLCWQYKPNVRPSFMEVVALLQSDVCDEFRQVSFYHSEEGTEYRMANGSVKTAPTALEEVEDFSLSDEDDDDDYKDLHSSASSKFSSRSSTPNGYVPQLAVKTTKC